MRCAQLRAALSARTLQETGLLQGYRSIRPVGQRYKIVYQIFEEKVSVAIVGVGRRKEGNKRDIYTLMEKLLENQESSE